MSSFGILGGGQLGQMLAQAGSRLGLKARVFDPKSDACAQSDAELFVGNFEDEGALTRFAQGMTQVTFEWENVPIEALETVKASGVEVFPSPRVLETTQDRLFQKTHFSSLSIGTAPYASVSSEGELEKAIRRIGFPAVLKTRRHGYDGKGQSLVRNIAEAREAWTRLGQVPLIAEGFVDFVKEVSIVAVRSAEGETVFYPLTENFHREGILRWSIAPARGSGLLQLQAQRIAERAIEALDYVGTLAIEFFVAWGDGGLLVNELAPRVHNSGHWTLDGSETSQFENHLRAGLAKHLGMKLGSTRPLKPFSGMVNLIGEIPSERELRELPGARVHLYGKSSAPGRKVGHIGYVEDRFEDLRTQMNAALKLLGEAPIT